MNGIDPRAFEFAVGKIDDGFVFESFGQSFISAVMGYYFMPVGGTHDRGIDGLEHTFSRKASSRQVYQLSIEKRAEAKIEDTLIKLEQNEIECETLTFVTNQLIRDKDKIVDRLFDKYKKPIRIFDLKWFSANANHNQATVNAFHTFVESYLHEFNQPGKSYVVSNLVSDPRLFVFLRQQWEEHRNTLNLDAVLADTLILFSLEGTDPDLGVFKTNREIKAAIVSYIKFDPRLLYDLLDERLKVLSSRPRQIHYHANTNGYCLPYTTRLAIREKNLKDAALYEEFKESVEVQLTINLAGMGVTVKDPMALMDATINRLFYQQGLEFSDFILHGQTQTFEKDLPELISSVVEESVVIEKNKEATKSALLITIRYIVYNGTTAQKSFLKRLSNTYMMLFLLQVDPKVATYFSSLASKLKIYVCTSVLVPALSEFYLDPPNRRHWNLLQGSRDAGVSLVVNQTILSELIGHFRRIIHVYEQEYKDSEEIYLADEMQTLYISELMIRAYFYAKREGKVRDFYNFIDNFVNPNLSNADSNLADWLRHEFGIKFSRTNRLVSSSINTKLNS
jgi:hypothetical protein